MEVPIYEGILALHTGESLPSPGDAIGESQELRALAGIFWRNCGPSGSLGRWSGCGCPNRPTVGGQPGNSSGCFRAFFKKKSGSYCPYLDPLGCCRVCTGDPGGSEEQEPCCSRNGKARILDGLGHLPTMDSISRCSTWPCTSTPTIFYHGMGRVTMASTLPSSVMMTLREPSWQIDDTQGI